MANGNTPAGNGGLRGGTQGGGGQAPLAQTGTLPGGNNAVQPSGGPRPKGTNGDPPDREEEGARRDDLYRVFEDDSRKPSEAAATQQARDDANVPPDVSRSGVDEGNPRQIPPDRPTP
jgi:hypothetical protein